MFYSCKHYVELDDLGNRKTICFYVNPVIPAKPEGEAKITEWEKQVSKIEELRSQSTYLGSVADRCYYFVPDGLELQEQEPELDVQKHATLSPEVETELKTNGWYANNQRHHQTISTLKKDVQKYSEDNLIELGSQIRDVASVLSAMLDKSYITLDASQSDLTTALNTIKRLSSSGDKVQEALGKVGL